MEERSQKDAMREAVRGDFRRLRERQQESAAGARPAGPSVPDPEPRHDTPRASEPNADVAAAIARLRAFRSR